MQRMRKFTSTFCKKKQKQKRKTQKCLKDLFQEMNQKKIVTLKQKVAFSIMTIF